MIDVDDEAKKKYDKNNNIAISNLKITKPRV